MTTTRPAKRFAALLMCIVLFTTLMPTFAFAAWACDTPKLISAIGKDDSSGHGIEITWQSVEDAEGYRIYRKTGSSKWTAIDETTDLTYFDDTAKGDTKYTYTVRALQGGALASDYNKSGISASWEVEVELENPGKLNAAAQGSGILFSWEAVPGAEAYRVYRKTSSSGWKAIKDDYDYVSFLDTTAKSDVKYTYTVRCLYGGVLVSGYDPGVTAYWGKTTRLPYPENQSAIASGAGIHISWDEVTGADSYRVYRKTEKSSWATLKDNVTDTEFQDNTAKENVTYIYTVRCLINGGLASDYDASGTSASWNEGTAGFVDTPELLKAEVGDDIYGILISWVPVDGADGYIVYRKTTGSWKELATVAAEIVDEMFYLDDTAKQSTKYTYTVRCVNDLGGFISGYDKTGVSASWKLSPDRYNPVLLGAAAYNGGIRVTWDEVSVAAKYRVYRKTGTSGSWAKLADTDKLFYEDNTAKSGTTYYYTVRCLNASGVLISNYDKEGVGTCWNKDTKGSAVAPILSGIGNGETGIFFEWEPVAGADSYLVERKDGNGSWAALELECTDTNFYDDSVSSGETYSYRVRAKGSGDYITDYSNTQSIKFYAMPVIPADGGLSFDPNGIKITWNAIDGAPQYVVYRKSESASSWSQLGFTKTTSYVDQRINADETYYYWIGVASNSKTPKILSANYQFEYISIKFTGRVAIQECKLVVDGVYLKWNSITDADEYEIWRKTSSGSLVMVATTNTTEWTDPRNNPSSQLGIVSGTTYTYIVRAKSAGEYTGSYDDKGVSIAYYGTPVLREAVPEGRGIKVTWEPVEGVSTYRIYRKLNVGTWIKVADNAGIAMVTTTVTNPDGTVTTTTIPDPNADPNVRTYLDNTVPSKTTATYTVSCIVNGKEVSVYDETGVQCVSEEFYDAPELESIANIVDGIQIKWKKVAGAPYYKVLRKETATGTTYQPISPLIDGSETEFIDTFVKNRGKYTYTVAVYTSDEKIASEYVENGLTNTYYSVPALISIENAAAGVTIKWKAVEGISSYRVYKQTGAGQWSAVATGAGKTGDAADERVYTDKSVTSSGTYSYAVACVISNNDVSGYDTDSPLAITFFAAPTVSKAENYRDEMEEGIKVTWNPVDGIATYNVYRIVDGGEPVLITASAVAGPSVVDTALETKWSGHKIGYMVYCVADDVEVSGKPDSAKTITYVKTPSITEVKAGTKTATVTWDGVTGAKFYNVYYKTTTASSWTQFKDSSGKNNFTGQKVTLTKLSSGVKYEIRVVAVANDNTRSAYSKTETVIAN